jgi:hypothetical protein
MVRVISRWSSIRAQHPMKRSAIAYARGGPRGRRRLADAATRRFPNCGDSDLSPRSVVAGPQRWHHSATTRSRNTFRPPVEYAGA